MLRADPAVRPVERHDVCALTENQWLERLASTVEARIVDGLVYPEFPEIAIQQQFVGSANRDALEEAHRFYRFTLSEARRLRFDACPAARYADFGCGWGRIGRFFLREFERGDMVGLDIDPDMIRFCHGANLPGLYLTIQNGAPLPFAENSFKLITAYSVFTHLPEKLFRAWMGELGRILAPKGVLAFTVEPSRFLDYIEGISTEPQTPWEAGLSRHKSDLPRHREALADSGVAFLPTGGGGARSSDIYGDTVVTPAFIRAAIAPWGILRTYVDDPTRFWQAAVIVQKRAGDNALSWFARRFLLR